MSTAAPATSLVGYASDDSDSEGESTTVTSSSLSNVANPEFALTLMNSAPLVELDEKGTLTRYVNPRTKEFEHNPTVDEMWRPLAGPFRPSGRVVLTAQAQGIEQNAVTGWAEKTNIDAFSFDEQYLTFQNYGYAADPSVNAGANRVIGEEKLKAEKEGDVLSGFNKKKETKEQKLKRKKRVETNGNIHDYDNFMGPWASYYYEEEVKEAEPSKEQLEIREMQAKKKQRTEREEEEPMEEFTTFHGQEERDGLGRTYMHPPPNLPRNNPDRYFAPKKCVHVWSGHKKGVNQIMFIPNTAHLLLSASMDETIKIWNVNGNRQCLRTMEGHTSSVRTIDFSSDGTKFYSGSYDRWVKEWDTETGQCISRHTTHKIPYCVRSCPVQNKEHMLLVAQSNKMVVQWDMRSGNLVQKYNEHLGPVNTVTFIDNNRKFVTTSDDKKVYIWEMGIPVVMKHISEPDMHSMPAVAVHPDGKYWIGQSQNNQIHVYGASRKFGLFRKKRFMGHTTAGYACQLGFSPCGNMVYSGDAQGRLFVWDWRSMKIWKRLQCHKQVTIGCIWNPKFPSRMATCSWDGTIKYWD
jgi:pre-mRNA-processing factor 17